MDKHTWLKRLRGDQSLSDRQFRVLVNLSTYADSDLTGARPSNETLAADVGCSVKTIKRVMHSLQDAGYIVATSVNRGGRGQTNEWAIRDSKPGHPDVTLSDPKPGHTDVTLSGSEWGSDPRRKGVRSASKEGHRGVPRSVDHVDQRTAPLCAVCGKRERVCRDVAAKTGDPHAFTNPQDPRTGQRALIRSPSGPTQPPEEGTESEKWK